MNPGPIPLLIVGMALSGAGGVLLLRQLLRRPGATGDGIRPARPVWAVSALLIVLGLAGIVAGSGLVGLAGQPVPAGAADGASVEVDYGFVELDHGGRAVAISSYKHGGSMLVRAGEVLLYQAIGDPPLPPLELHLAGRVVDLPGASGQISITGTAGEAQAAMMRAKGDRVSLPGGAPPRVSVKVQVTGPPRTR